MSDQLHQGRIVWIEMLDPQGRNPKVRPAVVVTDTDDIEPGEAVAVVAVTTQLKDAPADVSVELPWHRNGHPRTKLNRRNVAVCSWLTNVPPSEIVTYGGIVPLPHMTRILEIIRNATPSE